MILATFCCPDWHRGPTQRPIVPVWDLRGPTFWAAWDVFQRRLPRDPRRAHTWVEGGWCHAEWHGSTTIFDLRCSANSNLAESSGNPCCENSQESRMTASALMSCRVGVVPGCSGHMSGASARELRDSRLLRREHAPPHEMLFRVWL